MKEEKLKVTSSPEKSIVWILFKFRNTYWVDCCGVVLNLCGDDYRVVVLGFMVGTTIMQSFNTFFIRLRNCN